MIFRRTDKYGYSRYYGGGGPAFIIKVIVTILVVAALVLGGITLALQRYMVYTANGGHLELPWANSSNVSDDDGTGDNNDDNTGGVLVTEEEGDQSADAAEISADTSAGQNADASASTQPTEEETEPVAEEPEADVSNGAASSADASEAADEDTTAAEESDTDADTSAESGQDEEQVGFFQRIWNFFASLFAAKDNSGDASLMDEEGSASDSSASAEADSSAQADSDTSGDKSTQSGQTGENTTRPEALTGGLLLQHVSIGDVTTGYAEGDLKNVSANGIMLYLKESSGALNYASSLDLSAVFNASCSESKSATIADTIAELNESDYYTLAYVDCFQDSSAGDSADYQLYDTSGDAWYDEEDCSWADPANEDFQDYIVGMVQELATMGYDEVVLNNAAYPTTGDTDSLSADCYDPDTFEATISAFYAKLAEAVEGTDTIVSVITTTDAITGGADAVTGQTLENMLQLGGRLWVEADVDDAEALSQALTDAGYPDNALGLLVSSLDGDAAYCQMNLD
ncbi:MAG: putative glycoside hydrolase [Clostridiales bacterium]|nr:putative glycoside hydrolase [Clostridiales bacterium]